MKLRKPFCRKIIGQSIMNVLDNLFTVEQDLEDVAKQNLQSSISDTFKDIQFIGSSKSVKICKELKFLSNCSDHVVFEADVLQGEPPYDEISSVLFRLSENLCYMNEGDITYFIRFSSKMCCSHIFTSSENTVDLYQYVVHLVESTRMSTCTYFMALHYVLSLNAVSNLRLNRLNVRKLILVSIVLAMKYCEDNTYSNRDMARLGGVDCKELNRLEVVALQYLDYRLSISNKEYTQLLRVCSEMSASNI